MGKYWGMLFIFVMLLVAVSIWLVDPLDEISCSLMIFVFVICAYGLIDTGRLGRLGGMGALKTLISSLSLIHI